MWLCGCSGGCVVCMAGQGAVCSCVCSLFMDCDVRVCALLFRGL